MILRQITKQQSYSLFQGRRSYGALNKQCRTVTIVDLEELQLPTVVGTAGVLDISCPSCVIEECAWHGRGRSEYSSRTYMIEGTHGILERAAAQVDKILFFANPTLVPTKTKHTGNLQLQSSWLTQAQNKITITGTTFIRAGIIIHQRGDQGLLVILNGASYCCG